VPRVATEQRDEPRDTDRSGPLSFNKGGRADDNNSWRTREKTRLNRFVSNSNDSFLYPIIIYSWRANESDENENDRPSASGGPAHDDQRGENRRFGDDRRGQNRAFGSGNRE
jgi:hypothetical protein